MDGTPRLRSAFPATPAFNRRRTPAYDGSPPQRQRTSVNSLPEVPTKQQPQTTATTSPSEPLIPEHIIDAPSQRLYAVSFWVALWCWKCYDFYQLQDSEEQSLWLFMKWVVLDGIVLFGLPSMRIPWLEWSSATMTLLFCAHAFTDGMMMFRIPIPVGAALGGLGRSIWGYYEMAVNEHSVNPESVKHNDSLILGRQIVHILPEGSAILNHEKESFCIDGTRVEARLPITINSTNPVSIELWRVDLETQANETIHLGRSQLRNMHNQAKRLKSYSELPYEPKTLFWPVKKPGLYYLGKVVDETNLVVSHKRSAHTVVVPCPKVAVLAAASNRCRGELSNVEMEVVGTPPLRLKYRRAVDTAGVETILENIQPDDFFSPFTKIDHQALAVPDRVDTDWARPRTIKVPLSEGLTTSGTWTWAVEEVIDGIGNVVVYADREQDKQKTGPLHQSITVHDRPIVTLQGCSAQRPLKVASGESLKLPLRFDSTGKGEIRDTSYKLDYLFTPQGDLTAAGEHTSSAVQRQFSIKDSKSKPAIFEAGLYSLTGVSSDFCKGDVLEPSTCLLQNPPRPKLNINSEEIFDKCAGSPIGLRVDFDLIGTPPFEIHYKMSSPSNRHHSIHTEKVKGLRGQIELTPTSAGDYVYDFYEISDAVYENQPVKNAQLSQSVKPAASAKFVKVGQKTNLCIDETASHTVALRGEGPFTIEYELVHDGKRKKQSLKGIETQLIDIETDQLRDGGDYTLALASITDRLGCKEFLKDEAKFSVRHQKPRAGFGQIDGNRSVKTLEGKEVHLPIRLVGQSPWVVRYVDHAGQEHTERLQHPNDKIAVTGPGTYELINVQDSGCPGLVDETANRFEISSIPRPQLAIPPEGYVSKDGTVFYKADICEGDDDAVDVLFKGLPPFSIDYTINVKPERGVVTPRNKELRAQSHIATVRMDTTQAGTYEYKFQKLADANYDHNSKHFSSHTLKQVVYSRPSVAFKTPGKTYSYCSVQSAGEEVIPVTLHGVPPFELEIEVRHHSSSKTETFSVSDVKTLNYDVRIPHSRLSPGKSAVLLKRVSDAKGCVRSLSEATTPRVQISVHDAPTITALDSSNDYCVGQHLNFALSGAAPFTITYEFEGVRRKASTSSTTFRRLTEKPGTFTILSITDSASQCSTSTELTSHIHSLPSVRVSNGRESYIDIHEGSSAEILFEFGGHAPFEFTYTRSSNTAKGGKKGVILDMRSETSAEHSLRMPASEEGTYEVVAIKDRYCSYAKPGIKFDERKARKLLGN
nr:nucleoporin [Quercus suber]